MPDDKLVKAILEAQKNLDTRPYAAAIKEATSASRSIANWLQSIAGEDSTLRQVMESIRRNGGVYPRGFRPAVGAVPRRHSRLRPIMAA